MRLLAKLVFVAAMLGAASLSPASAGEGDGVRARLAQPMVLRGEFVQEKRLEGFTNPLRSSGDFLLLREKGVAWNTRAPFASTTRVTRDKVLASLPNGETRVLVDATNAPAMATINALLMALVGGDLGALDRHFVLDETLGKDGSWHLRLQPRDTALKRVFSRIELAGDRHVRRVDILETGGDRTRIRFDRLREAPPATRAEAAQFD